MHNILLFFFQVAVAAVLAVKIICDFVDNSDLNDHEENENVVGIADTDDVSKNG